VRQQVGLEERVAQLQNMFAVSCSPDDLFDYFHPETISVLTALLSHKNGSIRDLSCAILGNLLCWETYHNNSLPTIAPRAQVKARNALRSIVGLLTSPSASVNLAASGAQANKMYERINSIRSISSKRGARALVNAFCECPVPEEYEQQKEILPVAQQYQYFFFHKSGTLKETIVADFYVDDNGHVSGGGDDSLGTFRISGKAVQDMDGQVYLYKHHLLDNTRPYLNVVAYWSNGKRTPEHPCFGAGFYGIWENYSADPHYELSKGGVFRAVPFD